MANKVALATVKSAYAGHKSTLEKAIKTGAIPEGIIQSVHEAAINTTLNQYSGYLVEVEGGEEVTVSKELIEVLLLSIGERILLSALVLVPKDTQAEIDALLAQAKEKAGALHKMIVDSLGKEQASLLRFPKIPGSYELSAGRRRGSSGGAKTDRDWSQDVYVKGGRGKTAGYSIKVIERDNDGTPSVMESFDPGGESLGIANSDGHTAWAAAFDLIAESAGVNNSKTTNVPQWMGVPEIVPDETEGEDDES